MVPPSQIVEGDLETDQERHRVEEQREPSLFPPFS
jgi:hypothetical protein